MTQVEYARHAGVDPSTVSRWIKNQRITRESDGRIDPERADRERADSESPAPHHQARKAQFEERRGGLAADVGTALSPSAPVARPVSAGEPADDDLGRALKREAWRLQRARAEQASLDLDRAAGLLVERTEVEFLLADLGSLLQSQVDAMPAQLAPALAGRRGDAAAIHADLVGFGRDFLHGISAHLARAAARHLGAVKEGVGRD